MRLQLLRPLALVVLLAACAPADPRAADTPAGKAAIGSWGVELSALDRSVAPGDDFFRFANGGWLNATEIPPDQISWGSFAILQREAESELRALLETTTDPALRDWWRAYLDLETIERLGLEPLRADLARIEAARTHVDVARLMSAPDLPGDGPIALWIALDEKQPDRWVLEVGQSGLGLPDRDYYLSSDARFAETRAKYRAYVETLLALAQRPDAADFAEAILALETRIAELHWPKEKSRDRELTYNPRSPRALAADAPGFPWADTLDAFGAPEADVLVVAQLDAVRELAALFERTPVATWRAYLAFHLLSSTSDVLPEAFDRATFDFYGRTLAGAKQQRERWRRAISRLSGSPLRSPLSLELGRLYVERHFPPEAKREARRLVENLRAAYAARIAKLDWMSEETKRAALRKLETLEVKIGYPDAWSGASGPEVRAGDAWGNARRELAQARARDLARLRDPVDRSEWAMVPHRVNAYYNAGWNEIVFPAAILQPPFFDPHADPAVNYGGIGAVIGHEMGHAFDDQGAKSDEHGVLRSWWRPEDERAFEARTERLVEQYARFEALPGLFVNGRLTLGENIGDLGGLGVALEGYALSLAGAEPPRLDGWTGVQRFFLGFAQIWRTRARDEALRLQVLSDPHSPAEFRVNGSVRNLDAWYEAFGVGPDARLYLAPEERVRIW